MKERGREERTGRDLPSPCLCVLHLFVFFNLCTIGGQKCGAVQNGTVHELLHGFSYNVIYALIVCLF